MNSLRKYLQKAKKEKFALGQFNFSTAEQLKAIVQAGLNLNAPLIAGVSRGEASFIGLPQAAALVKAWREQTRKERGKAAVVFLNLDHARDPAVVSQAIELGFDGVHFDGSEFGFEENIKITKRLAAKAHKKGVVVEGEIDRFGSEASKVYQDKFKVRTQDLTDPAKAVRFVKASGVDSLAINIGSFHGVQTKGFNPSLDLARLRELAEVLAKTFLVLHGSSGTPPDDVVQGIAGGIVKINVNTDLRLAYAGGLKKSLAAVPSELAPYKYLQPGLEAVQAAAEQKIRLFGTAGKA